MSRYPNYQPTNIPWLPEIPEGWEMRRLKNISTSFSKGSGITKDDTDENGDTPCLRYGEIYTKYRHSFTECVTHTNISLLKSPKFFTYGNILFTCTGELVEEIGKSIVYLGQEKSLAGGDIVIMTHLQNPSFLNYALNSKYAQNQKSYGKDKLKVVHISVTELGNVNIALPPLSEQERIVAYLDKQTAKVDALIKAKTEQMALLKELRERTIADAVTRGLPSEHTSFKSTNIPWLPEIPEGWEMRRLKSLFTQRSETYTPDEKLIVLSLIKDVGVIPYEEKGNIGNKSKEDISTYNVARKGDIVLNSMNVIIGSVDITHYDGYISPAYYAITAKPNVSTRYYNYIFHLKAIQKHMRCLAKGIMEIRLRISTTNLFGLYLPVPPLSEQERIVAYLDEQTAKIDKAVALLASGIEHLKAYRDRLIADVVTGQLKVE